MSDPILIIAVAAGTVAVVAFGIALYALAQAFKVERDLEALQRDTIG